MKDSNIMYMAIPFTGTEEQKKYRYETVNKICADLMNQGKIVFSPVTMGWPIAEATEKGLPTDWEYWQDTCYAFLNVCYKIVVITVDGWKESTGVQAEIKIAEELGLEIEYLSLDDFYHITKGGFPLLHTTSNKFEEVQVGQYVKHQEYFIQLKEDGWWFYDGGYGLNVSEEDVRGYFV